jgi:fermentation-respiration switch protein FrsA (DUF1100 family)
VLIRTISRIVLVLIIFYTFGSPLTAQRIYDRAILYPQGYSAEVYQKIVVNGVKGRDIFFDSLDNKHKLHARYFLLPGANKTVIVSHGIGGNLTTRNDLTAIILGAGASVFIYDYQGYGRSAGTASLNTVCDDGLAAYRYVTGALRIRPSNVVACGESMGTGVSCFIAEHASVSGLILQSPFTCLASRCAEIVPLLQGYPSWTYPTSGLDNRTWVSHIKAPLLVVHGERDSMIPVRHAREVFDAATSRKELVIVPAAAHTGDPALMNSPLYSLAVRKFLTGLN